VGITVVTLYTSRARKQRAQHSHRRTFSMPWKIRNLDHSRLQPQTFCLNPRDSLRVQFQCMAIRGVESMHYEPMSGQLGSSKCWHKIVVTKELHGSCAKPRSRDRQFVYKCPSCRETNSWECRDARRILNDMSFCNGRLFMVLR
jgi:predicted RNA-binding Zn-ribbon protein involved in translation (DUF1610 family)